MYNVTFSQVNKKVLRSVKALKTKDGHSLHKAEGLLKEIHSVTDGSTKVTITVNDNDNEMQYIFDDISVNPNGESPELMEILEEQILSSGHEDAPAIINGIEKQYELEKEEVEVEISKTTKPKKSKGINLFAKKNKAEKASIKPKKKKSLLSKKETEDQVSLEDFSDLKEEEETVFDQEEIKNDFIEVPVESDFPMGNDDMESISQEYSVEETLNDGESEETDSSEDEYNYVAEDYIVEEFDQEPNEIESEEVYKSKNEKIIFPAYDNYLDLSTMNNTIDRNKDRFEKDHLVKFLGLNALSFETVQTELDEIKLNYALNSLDEAEFILLKDYFYNAVENIKDKTQTQLSQTYEKAMSFDYQEEANINSEEEVKKLYEASEQKLANYSTEQTEEYDLKLEKFNYEQEKALEDFKRQQSLEKSIFVQEIDAKKSARYDLFKGNIQEELDRQKDSLLDDKMCDLKNLSITQLTETKRLAVRNFEKQLDNAVDNIWTNIQNALKKLELDIESRIPAWKEEIKEKRQEEAEKREEERKQRQLELEKEQLELQRQKFEFEQTGKVEKEEESLANVLEKKFSEYDEMLKSALKDNKKTEEQSVEPQNAGKIFNKKKRKTLFTSVAVLALLSGGVLTGKVLSTTTVPEDQTVKAEEISQYEQMSEALLTLEKKLSLPDEETSPSLDSLLTEKNYERAMSLYKDQNSLEKIEETLFLNEDLATLITFNKINKTTYGEIDEATLSKDKDKVLDLYTKLTKEDLEKLTPERKSNIALLLYQKNETKLAEILLGINDKEVKEK